MQENNEYSNDNINFRGINRGGRSNRYSRIGYRGKGQGRGRGRGRKQNQENYMNRGRERGRRPVKNKENYKEGREEENINNKNEQVNENFRGKKRGKGGRIYRGNYRGRRETEKNENVQLNEDFKGNRAGRKGQRLRGRGRFPGFRGKSKKSKNVDYYFEYVINQEEERKKIIIEQENKLIKFSKKDFIDSFQNIKFNKELLDEYQLNAVELCLKKKLCFIQGPPGTGKTYLATIIANLILRNLSNLTPIIIISSSEKALAHIINNIIEYRDNTNRINEDNRNKNIIDSNYLKILDELMYLGNQKILADLINEQRDKISIIKLELFKRVADDFYNIAQNSIDRNILLERNKIIESKIYHFWNNIGNKDNDPTEIIFKLLSFITDDEERIMLFKKIYNNLKKFLKYPINDAGDLDECEDHNINLIENDNKENDELEESDEINNKNENLD